MRAWAAALSPGNGHLGGGLPRKRPPGPLAAPYAGNGHLGGGVGGKPPLHGSVLIDHIWNTLPPTQESLFTTRKLFFFIGPSGIDSHTTSPQHRHSDGTMAKKGRRHAKAVKATKTNDTDRCHPCAGQPQPEAEAMECNTCCYPFSKQDLFGCDTDQCDYIQCKDCIIKGKSGLCSQVGCLIMHWSCPACTNNAGDGSLKLTDDRFTKDDVLAVLDKVRKHDASRMRNAMEMEMEMEMEILQEMDADAREDAREAASWYP
jgi:hypothetical protein